MGKTIYIKALKWKGSDKARFDLTLQGFDVGKEVTVDIWEVDKHPDYVQHGDKKIGTIVGTVIQPDKTKPKQYLSKTGAIDTAKFSTRVVFETDQKSGIKSYAFDPYTTGEEDEGGYWEIQVRLRGDPSVRSGLCYVARFDRRVPSAQATYRWHRGHDVKFYADASEDQNGKEGYFADLSKAIEQARHFILVADWSFHPYMRLIPTTTHTIGQKLADWARGHTSGVVAIHTWDHTSVGSFGAPDPQNDEGNKIFKNEIVKPGNMYWRMSSRTGEDGAAGWGWSHHQKFVVMDCPATGDKQKRRTIRAFIGGIDLTQGRFDWPEHPFRPADPRCRRFRQVTNKNRKVHDWHNPEFGSPPLSSDKSWVRQSDSETFPRQAWHDIHCQIVGPSVWDVVREFIGRWNVDPVTSFKAKGDIDAACIARLQKLLAKDSLFDKKKFVQQWDPHNGKWWAQILRSITRDHWELKGTTVVTPARHKKKNTEFVWAIRDKEKERSIQDAYLRVIDQAEHFIYIESQYFIGSGLQWKPGRRLAVRNEVPERLATRILSKAYAGQPFHVYLLLPMFPEGKPSGWISQAQRDFQWNSLAYIIRKVQQGLQKHKIKKWWWDYLTVGFLANWEHLSGKPTAPSQSRQRKKRVLENRRYMIYVHSKMMIVDDSYVIIGSANMNERSLAGGRDSEICGGLWPDLTKQAECRSQIRKFREKLWAEHFGRVTKAMKRPEGSACVKEIQRLGKDNWKLLEAGKMNLGGLKKTGSFCTWPIDRSKDDLGLRGKKNYIIDGEPGGSSPDDWYWWPTKYVGKRLDLAE